MAIVVLVGTLDTKGAEYGWLKERLLDNGVDVVVVDAGVIGEPRVRADIPRAEVARSAGLELERLRAEGDRGAAVTAMAGAAAETVRRLHAEDRLHAVLAIGGSGGTSIATRAMRSLPLGVPKVMVSSMAAGDVSPYVGSSDITMMYSVVDIAGINSVLAAVLANAADAAAGMAKGFAAARRGLRPAELGAGARPLVAASMAGVTTPGVDAARERLTGLGYEVLVFHASGAGGRTLETLAGQGLFAGVLDLTLSELADDLGGRDPDRGARPADRGGAAGCAASGESGSAGHGEVRPARHAPGKPAQPAGAGAQPVHHRCPYNSRGVCRTRPADRRETAGGGGTGGGVRAVAGAVDTGRAGRAVSRPAGRRGAGRLGAGRATEQRRGGGGAGHAHQRPGVRTRRG